MKTSFPQKPRWLISLAVLVIVVLTRPGATPTPALAQSSGPPLLFVENVGQLPTPAGGEAIRFQVYTDQATDFPVTPGAFDNAFSGGYGGDAFVAKLTPGGNALVYATYLGGNHHDYGEDLAIDSAGGLYLTGITYSADFPTTIGAFDNTCGGCSQLFAYPDGYVAHLRPDGSLDYGTFLGGDNNYDRGYGIALAGPDLVFVTGDTSASNFPTTPGAFDTVLDGYGDAYVAKLFIRPGSVVAPPPVPPHTCAPTLLGTILVQQGPRGLAVDSTHQRVYISSGFAPGLVTVLGDHARLCSDAMSKIAALEAGETPPPNESDAEIGIEIFVNNDEATPPPSTLSGDVNGDGRVNIFDLALIASHYGTAEPTADLNGDGRVDVLDLVAVSEQFGR
jgi:hypothetical protein